MQNWSSSDSKNYQINCKEEENEARIIIDHIYIPYRSISTAVKSIIGPIFENL